MLHRGCKRAITVQGHHLWRIIITTTILNNDLNYNNNPHEYRIPTNTLFYHTNLNIYCTYIYTYIYAMKPIRILKCILLQVWIVGYMVLYVYRAVPIGIIIRNVHGELEDSFLVQTLTHKEYAKPYWNEMHTEQDYRHSTYL